MPTYGYNRSITRVAVNPRLAFGVPLDKLCSEGRLHPGLRDLFLKAHLCADSEGNLRRKRNQPEDNSDVSHTVIKLLEPRGYGLGTSGERLFLKQRLEAGEWIVATPTSPGAPLGLLEHFLGCLPTPIFGEKIWTQLSEECKEYVEKAVTGSPNTCFLIQKLARCLKGLSVGEFLTVAALLGLMRNLAMDDRTKDLNKTAVMALVRLFIPSLVSRPYKPGVTSSEIRQKYPLLLFLCYYWPEIREECEYLSRESYRSARCSSLTSIQQKGTAIGQKKCMSLPNNGVDKQRTEQQKLKQSFVKSFLPTDIPQRCINLNGKKPNNNGIKHQPQCIWKPIFLEKEVEDTTTFFDDKNHVSKPASVFICSCCGICSERVDRETQCDESILLYHRESSNKYEENSQIQFEYPSRSSSVSANYGSETEFSDFFHASAFSSKSAFCPCDFPERDTNGSYKTEHQNYFSQSTSASFLLKDLLTSSSEIPFYIKEASSMTCLNGFKPFMTESLKVSTKTEENTACCSTMMGNMKESTKTEYLSNEIIREKNYISESSAIPLMQDGLKSGNKGEHKHTTPEEDENNPTIGEENDMPTSENSAIPTMEDGLKSANKEHTCTASGQGGNNSKSSHCKSTECNQRECKTPAAAKFLKTLNEDGRCHTESYLLQNRNKIRRLSAKHKNGAAKAKTYPLQSGLSKEMLATTSEDADDKHPRRVSDSAASPRGKRLRFKARKWLREVLGHGTFRRTSSSHEPDSTS